MPTNTLSNMRRIFRIIDRVIRYWWVIALTVIVLCLASCKTQYVPVETVRTEHVYNTEFLRDSIFVKDSVFLREKNDTVYLTKWRVEYREALRVDTFIEQRTDSIPVIVPVEKSFTRWQKFKLSAAGWIVFTIPVALLIYILYRRFKK